MSQGVPPELYPTLPAIVALRRILRPQLAIVDRCVAGTIDGTSADPLHDLRVAVRRTRCGLGRVRGVLAPDRFRHFRKEFRWVGRVSGTARDLDVFLLKLAEYRAELADEAVADFELLRLQIEAHRQAAYADLRRALEGARFSQLRREWRAFLESTEQDPGVDAREPIRRVAAESVRKAHRKALNRGMGLDAGSPYRDFHRMRIAGKRLRYLLEFFAPLFALPKAQAMITSLKQIQDSLGDYNDYCVQGQWLVELVPELGERPSAAAGAMRSLYDLLARGRERERRGFRGLFEGFAENAGESFVRDMVLGGPT